MEKALRDIKQLYINSFEGLSRDVWLLALMTLINRSGTMVIIFMTIYLTEELDWSLTQAGIAMSVFGLGSAAGSFVGGWLTDRIGYYATMFWSLLIGGASFFVLMYMHDFYEYCVTVFFVSAIGDAFRPASLASISAYGKLENQNRSLSLIRLAINLGFAIGVGGAGLISEYFGFKYLFIIDGITCIFAAIFLRIILEEKAERSTFPGEKIVRRPEESAYRDRLYLFFAFFILLNGMVFSQLWNTIPVYYTDILNISKADYGWIMVLNGILIFAFEMPIVYIFEKKYSPMSLVFIGAVMITFGFLIYNLTSFWQLAISVSILAVSFGEIIAFPFSNAFSLGRSKPGRRGEYMGIYTMAWSIATVLAPTLGMYIAETYSFRTLWYAVSGVGTVACLGFLYIRYRLKTEIIKPSKKEMLEVKSIEV